jgi:hypothetical protein
VRVGGLVHVRLRSMHTEETQHNPPPVDVIAEKDVICVGTAPTDAEQLRQVVVPRGAQRGTQKQTQTQS